MKFVLILSFAVGLYAQDLHQRVKDLISPPQKSAIVKIKYDPFEKTQKVIERTFAAKPQERALYVTTIFNNRVFINSRWHREGDEVGGFKIIQILENEVLAKRGEKVVKLGIKRERNIVNIEGKK